MFKKQTIRDYWDHSMGPLCHALSLSTSMRRRRATRQ